MALAKEESMLARTGSNAVAREGSIVHSVCLQASCRGREHIYRTGSKAVARAGSIMHLVCLDGSSKACMLL